MSEQEVVPDKMRAIHLPQDRDRSQPPSPSSLLYSSDYPTPTPSPNQYLIQIHTAALTCGELTLTSPAHTSIPAHEFCGIVISTPSVDMTSATGPTFKIGDEVFGLIGLDREGAGADYAVVEEGEMGFKPRNVSAGEAVGVPLGGLMAWQVLEGAGLRSSLIDEAEVSGEEGKDAGEDDGGDLIRVLVMGATSKVGKYVIQLLRANSAPFDGGIRRRKERKRGKHEDRKNIFWICATCSSDGDVPFLSDLGADAVVVLESHGDDRTGLSQTFVEFGWEPVDVVLDCDDEDAGSPDAAVSLASSPDVVRRDGGWEVLKINPPEWSVEMVDVVDKKTAASKDTAAKNKSWSFTVQPNGVQLAEIAEVIEKGELKPIAEREFGLYEGREAMEMVESAEDGKGAVLRANN